jgi:hypothetical protein
MDFYDEDFFWRLALPPIDCLGGWIVPLLLDKSRYSLLCKDNIRVIKFI